jgi:hypothetical protein
MDMPVDVRSFFFADPENSKWPPGQIQVAIIFFYIVLERSNWPKCEIFTNPFFRIWLKFTHEDP